MAQDLRFFLLDFTSFYFIYLFIYLFIHLFILVELRFQLRALYVQHRPSTAWNTPPVYFSLVNLEMGVSRTICLDWLRTPVLRSQNVILLMSVSQVARMLAPATSALTSPLNNWSMFDFVSTSHVVTLSNPYLSFSVWKCVMSYLNLGSSIVSPGFLHTELQP
jgi:hypothetical protein